MWGVLAALALVAVPALTMAQERSEPRRTAVADAAQAGDRDAVRALLKQGADVNASQGDGTTALHWAAMKGDAEMVQMLVTPARTCAPPPGSAPTCRSTSPRRAATPPRWPACWRAARTSRPRRPRARRR